MDAEVADLVLALEDSPFVASVRALRKPTPGWPSLIVVMRDDTAYALGAVTGMIVRALPGRDRAHVGVASEARLRELWVPLSGPIHVSSGDRAAATVRAAERLRAEAATPAPISAPAVAFEPNVVWRLSDRRMVRIEIVADPFPEPPVLVVGDEALRVRALSAATRQVRVVHATTVDAALDAVELERPRRILCSESNAFGDDGFVARLERAHPSLLGAVEIACSVDGSEWVESYLAARNITRVRVVAMEELAVDDDDDELLDVWLERDG